MFFPYRGEIVPRVSKVLERGARLSPQHAGQEAGSIRTTPGTRLGCILTFQDLWMGLGSGEQGRDVYLKTVSRSG